MLLTIGFAVAAEDVRHFQLRAIHRAQRLEVLRWFGLDLHRDRTRQQIQRTRCRADFAGRYAEIFCRCGQAAMTEQQLNGTNIGALFQQVNRKSVSKRMRRDGFRNLANTVGLLALTLDCKSCDVLAREVSWEEPVLGLFDSPPGTQNLQEFRREHRVPIFPPFTLLDPDDHALAVDRGRCECDGFGDAQACGIAGGQDGVMFPAPDSF